MGGKNNIYKGWNYFVEAMNNVPQIMKDEILVVLFGCDFSAEELDELKFNAFSAGVISDEEELVQLYNCADVYVFPSLYESFGQTVYEAMSCGTPVVAFNVGAVSDVVIHLINGYIAEYENSHDLASGIIYCLSKENSEYISCKSREAIANKFSSYSVLEKHIALLQ